MLKLLTISALRHRKDGLASADGEALVQLPPLTVEERFLDLDDDERHSYDELHEHIKERVGCLTRGHALGYRGWGGLLLGMRSLGYPGPSTPRAGVLPPSGGDAVRAGPHPTGLAAAAGHELATGP